MTMWSYMCPEPLQRLVFFLYRKLGQTAHIRAIQSCTSYIRWQASAKALVRLIQWTFVWVAELALTLMSLQQNYVGQRRTQSASYDRHLVPWMVLQRAHKQREEIALLRISASALLCLNYDCFWRFAHHFCLMILWGQYYVHHQWWLTLLWKHCRMAAEDSFRFTDGDIRLDTVFMKAHPPPLSKLLCTFFARGLAQSLGWPFCSLLSHPSAQQILLIV